MGLAQALALVFELYLVLCHGLAQSLRAALWKEVTSQQAISPPAGKPVPAWEPHSHPRGQVRHIHQAAVPLWLGTLHQTAKQ